jgi:hypothetical protein
MSKKKDENIIRKISNKILKSIKKSGFKSTIGIIYTYIHYLIIFLVAFVFAFNTSVFDLCILLVVVSLDAFAVVVLHGCPLTSLEQKYLNTNSSDERCNILKKSKILYTCEHEYEKQIELMINIWLLVAGKCLILLFMNTYKKNLMSS